MARTKQSARKSVQRNLLEADREVVLAAVKQNGWAIQYASVQLKADREVVLAAVKQNGLALNYASVELRADREVVLAAVEEDGWALKYASAELRADREVVLAADREVVLTAVKRNGWALDYASVELQADRDVVLAAVKQDGRALEYASVELQADREVVLAAVQQDGYALNYASFELKADREIREAASKQSAHAVRLAELKAVKGADKRAKTRPTAATGPAQASSSEAADASALVLGEGERRLLADEAGGHSSLIRHLADAVHVEVSMQDVERTVSDGNGMQDAKGTYAQRTWQRTATPPYTPMLSQMAEDEEEEGGGSSDAQALAQRTWQRTVTPPFTPMLGPRTKADEGAFDAFDLVEVQEPVSDGDGMQAVEGTVSDGDGEVAFEGETTLAERNARLRAGAVDVESFPFRRIRKATNRLDPGVDPGVGTRKRIGAKRTLEPRTADGSPVRSSARRAAAPTIKQEDFLNGDINCPSCKCGIYVSAKGCNLITCRSSDHTGRSWFTFCYHCRSECPGGLPCPQCPERNDEESRLLARELLNKAANEAAERNPIIIDDIEEDD